MQQNPIITGSILSADFSKLGQEVNDSLTAGADWVHFDVMDHHYVPNLTFGAVVCESLRSANVTCPIDVHLMVDPVEPFIEEFAKAGATYITVHPDTTKHLDRVIQQIKQAGCKAGVAYNPATPLTELELIIDKLDMVLLMTVNPGFGGQKFIDSVYKKISAARKLIDDAGLDVRLQVDGGVNDSNIKKIWEAGADTFVVGSHLFHSNDYSKTIATLRSQIG